MTFRAKTLIVFTLAVAGAVGALTWGAMRLTRQQFAQLERQQSDAAVAQFQRELAQRGDEVSFAVQGLADAESTLRMAINLSQPQADPSMYANDARGLANSRRLDFLELVGSDGVLISSAQWPGRVGYKSDWVVSEPNWNQQGAFISRVESPDSVSLGLLTVRVVTVGSKSLYIVGGRRLDATFLQTLSLPPGMRALLYSNLEPSFVPAALSGASGAVEQPERFAPFIGSLQQHPSPAQTTIEWTPNPASAENVAALPLTGRDGSLLGVLLVGSAQRDLITLLTHILTLGLGAGAGAILLELLLGFWISSGFAVPLERLTAGAREVAAGSWTARVDVRAGGEIGRLAAAFNAMMRQLTERRELLMQTERVSAWREMAQRMSSELKEPLLQIHATLENMSRTREQAPERFDEVFFDSVRALRAELAALKTAASQFTDFAHSPAPQLRPVNVNEAVREVVKAFEPQFSSIGRPPISPDLRLDESLPAAQADPELLSRGLVNLVAHSVAAMPAGGTLALRTSLKDSAIRIEVADTGAVLSSGEQVRVATQPYTTKLRGTGLGLATVQSVICDQGGRISVEWAPGVGSTFRIELPALLGVAAPARAYPEPASAPPAVTQSPAQSPAQPQVQSQTAQTVQAAATTAWTTASTSASAIAPQPEPVLTVPMSVPVPVHVASAPANPIAAFAPGSASAEVPVAVAASTALLDAEAAELAPVLAVLRSHAAAEPFVAEPTGAVAAQPTSVSPVTPIESVAAQQAPAASEAASIATALLESPVPVESVAAEPTPIQSIAEPATPAAESRLEERPAPQPEPVAVAARKSTWLPYKSMFS